MSLEWLAVVPNIILTRGAGNAEDVAAIPGYYTLYREVHSTHYRPEVFQEVLQRGGGVIRTIPGTYIYVYKITSVVFLTVSKHF